MDNADKSEKEEVFEVGDGEKVKIGESKHIQCMAFHKTISTYTRFEKWFLSMCSSFFWFCHSNTMKEVIDDIVYTTVLYP